MFACGIISRLVVTSLHFLYICTGLYPLPSWLKKYLWEAIIRAYSCILLSFYDSTQVYCVSSTLCFVGGFSFNTPMSVLMSSFLLKSVRTINIDFWLVHVCIYFIYWTDLCVKKTYVWFVQIVEQPIIAELKRKTLWCHN